MGTNSKVSLWAKLMTHMTGNTQKGIVQLEPTATCPFEPSPLHSTHECHADPRWLVDDLAHVNRYVTPWVIVVLHAPWYNSNSHHQNETEEYTLRILMEPVLFRFQVDVLFAGHVRNLHWMLACSYRTWNFQSRDCICCRCQFWYVAVDTLSGIFTSSLSNDRRWSNNHCKYS